MTYTLSKLSGKAIRLVARYLAIIKMGGRLGDTPEQFYTKYTRETGESAVEAERKFGILTDAFEEKIRDEEGFLGDHYDVVTFVKEKLGDGFSRDGEVVADHRKEGVPQSTPAPRKTSAANPAAKVDVDKLLKELKSCKDPKKAKLIRRQLRRSGHRGGLRG